MHTLQGQQSGMVGSQVEIFLKICCEMFFETSSENQITDWNCEIFLQEDKIT